MLKKNQKHFRGHCGGHTGKTTITKGRKNLEWRERRDAWEGDGKGG